jgi:glycosyltransferase involved in cell wall biosynthesis
MKIAIDLTPLLKHRTGVDVYMLELTRYLLRANREHSFMILSNFEDREALDGDVASNCRVIPVAFRSRAARFLAGQVALPVVASLEKVDIVHSPSFFMPLSRGKAKHVITVHDLTSYSLPQHHTRFRRSFAYLKLLAASIRRADLICVPSQATRQQLQEYFPKVVAGRIRVIPHGISERFRPVAPEEVSAVRQRLQLHWPYILFVGTLGSRKNLFHLLDSYSKLAEQEDLQEHLVLVGLRESGSRELLRRIESPELQQRVHLLGYVADEDLSAVYCGATIFVYPSISEGFGLPPFEAMACGTPVIVSQIPAFTENLAGAAEFISLAEPGALGEATRRLLSDASLRARYRAAGLQRAKAFCWQRTAAETMRCYEELGARN